MKSVRFLVTLATLTLGALTLSAQTPAAPAAKPGKVVPLSRIAWINSGAFVAEETGIKQLVRVLKQMELEFSGQQSELSLLQEKLRTLVGELQKLQAGGAANADAMKQKQTEGLALQQELQAKQQQFQAALQQAQQDKQGPIATEMSKAIAAYAKERELGVVFDAAKMGDALVSAQPELDVTEDFIAYYNASHP
jgi:Skp family chaperone for outer membrane proteins